MRRLFVLGFIAVLVAGCGASAREKALSYTLAGLDGAREGFVAYNQVVQERIIDQSTSFEDGQEKLKAYRGKREPVMQAFMVAYSALALAAVEPKGSNLTEAMTKASELYAAIKEFKESIDNPTASEAQPTSLPASTGGETHD